MGLIIGIIIGGFLGMLYISMTVAASRADEALEKIVSQEAKTEGCKDDASG